MKIRFTRIIYSVIARNQGERKTQKKEINNLFHQECLFFRRESPDSYIIRKAHALIRKVTWFRSTPTQGITPKSQANICVNPTESRSTRYRQHKFFSLYFIRCKDISYHHTIQIPPKIKHRNSSNTAHPLSSFEKQNNIPHDLRGMSPRPPAAFTPGARSYSPSQKAKQRQHPIIDAVAVSKISCFFDRRWRNAHSASDVL